MTNGDIVYTRYPITIDSSADVDESLTIEYTNDFFPKANYNVIHTEIVFDEGSKTKATAIIIAQDIITA